MRYTCTFTSDYFDDAQSRFRLGVRGDDGVVAGFYDDRERRLFLAAPDLHAFARMISRLSASGDGEGEREDGTYDTGHEHDTGDGLDTLDAIIMRARQLLGQPHDERAAIMHPRDEGEG